MCKEGRVWRAMNNKIKATVFCFFVSILILFLEYWWIRVIIRINAMRVAYILILAIFVAIAFFVFISVKVNAGRLKVAVIGALAGALLGTAALTMSNLALDNGLERLVRDVHLRGVDAIFFDFPFSIILGSWLVGCFSFLFSYELFLKMSK